MAPKYIIAHDVQGIKAKSTPVEWKPDVVALNGVLYAMSIPESTNGTYRPPPFQSSAVRFAMHVRKLDPEDVAKLDKIDHEILALRALREETIRAAWNNGELPTNEDIEGWIRK